MKAQSIGTMAACCGILLIQSVVADTSATADSAVVLERADDGGGGPAFELAVDFCSRQLTYGLVDNRDPIFTVEALAEWHGFTFEAAMIFDTTKWGRKHGGYGNRQGTYQELAFGPGYIYALSPEDVRLLPTTVELCSSTTSTNTTRRCAKTGARRTPTRNSSTSAWRCQTSG